MKYIKNNFKVVGLEGEYIFSGIPYYIRTTIYDFFVIVCKFVQPNVYAHVVWSEHKSSHAKSKLTRNETLRLLES